MRVALAQIISSADPRANLELVAAAVRDAADAGARLVVLPEATMCRFGVPLGPVAEPLDGPWVTEVTRIADAAGVTAVAGAFTPGSGGRVRNTLVAVGAGVSASYDKVHLFDAFGFAESDTVEAGTEPVVIDVDGVGVGLSTCYDLRFPGLFQTLADRGARVCLVAASWAAGPGKVEQWELLTSARALDSTCFVLACGQGDPASRGEAVGKAPTGVGASRAVDPFGRLIGSLGPDAGQLVVDLDPGLVDAARAAIPVLANRRF